jgi:hypothetical protein
MDTSESHVATVASLWARFEARDWAGARQL